MQYKIYSAYFNYPWDNQFSKLKKAFEKSIKINIPNISYTLDKIDFPKNCNDSERLRFVSNVKKLEYWKNAVLNSKENLVLIDTDTIILKDISEVFVENFDIGYTLRNDFPYINGGVIFVKPTENSKNFFKLFYDINLKMFKNKEFHKIWYAKYLGINQAAFGYLLENPELYNILFKTFPCSKYNSVNCDWKNFNSDVSILHIKDDLRRLCLSSRNIDMIPKEYQNAAIAIRQYLK